MDDSPRMVLWVNCLLYHQDNAKGDNMTDLVSYESAITRTVVLAYVVSDYGRKTRLVDARVIEDIPDGRAVLDFLVELRTETTCNYVRVHEGRDDIADAIRREADDDYVLSSEGHDNGSIDLSEYSVEEVLSWTTGRLDIG
jgi:hypothetical protein